MIRVLFRLAGIVLLAGAFVALVVDGTRSIAASQVLVARLGEQLPQIIGPKFAQLQPLIERNLSPLLWNPVLVTVLNLPTGLVLLIFGMLLVLATRRRDPKIGYVTRT